MSSPRALVVTTRILRQLRRDRRTLALLFLQPLLTMAIFGYAFGGDVTGARLAVANLDRGTLGAEVLRFIDREIVSVVALDTETQVETAVLDQRVRAGLLIPANFTRNVEEGGLRGEAAYLVLYKDNTNPQVTGEIQKEIGEALEDALDARFDRDPAFDFDERVLFGGEDERNLEFLVPGIAAWAIFIQGAMLTAVAIVKERALGTLSRILASPARRWEVVVGYTLGFSVFSLAQAAVVLGIASLVFRIPIRGSVIVALLAALLVGMMALGLGILISGLAENEFQAVQTVILIMFPNLFLAGVFAPLESLPAFVRPFSWVTPLTYSVEALRGVINYGETLAEVGGNLAVLGAFTALFLGIAAATFGRRA